VHPLLMPFTSGVQLSGDLQADMVELLTYHSRARTAGHCTRVAAEARRLADQYGGDQKSAEIAGWLHDISAIIPSDQRVILARQLKIDVLPEEVAAPMILHQKLAAVIAREVMGVTDESVLSAIACHTTLKANASSLDKIVFVADKIAWDGVGDPPYLEAILAAAKQSLDRAVWCYLDYLWRRRDTIPALHPLFVEAHQQFSQAYG
jgi:predicted HD superfamily hydrolase involved in NAD metabolism